MWDCGKPGYTRNHCKVKRKINELPISDEEKQRLPDLLNENNESDLELLEFDEVESSEEIIENDDDGNCECNHYQTIMNVNSLIINMITAQKSILLDLIDSIENKEQQRTIIEKVLVASKEMKLKQKTEAVVKSYLYNNRGFRSYEKGKTPYQYKI